MIELAESLRYVDWHNLMHGQTGTCGSPGHCGCHTAMSHLLAVFPLQLTSGDSSCAVSLLEVPASEDACAGVWPSAAATGGGERELRRRSGAQRAKVAAQITDEVTAAMGCAHLTAAIGAVDPMSGTQSMRCKRTPTGRSEGIQ